MVAGDLVNTASRVQSVAEPGTVFVGESTRRATEQTIVYEDAGTFELKGKEGLTPLWRALRVVSGVARHAEVERPRGAVRRPRPGAAADQGALPRAAPTSASAHLVSVTGIAGIGKSRLAWEFYKYFDGLAELRLLAPRPLPRLRRGCHVLGARGHGADALPDRRGRGASLRARASCGRRSRSTSSTPTSARFVEPRLAQLLGLGEHESRDRQDLFAAWRLFFERLADVVPDRARLRGHAVGRRVAARLRRVPARVVAQPPALRDHARAAGAARAPTDLGRRPPQLHVAVPRAALGAGDGGAARRPRPGPAGGLAGADPRPRRGRSPLRGRDGAHAARPRPARRRRAPCTGRSARSTSSRCRRRCTR